jgi:hypothetical protein
MLSTAVLTMIRIKVMGTIMILPTNLKRARKPIDTLGLSCLLILIYYNNIQFRSLHVVLILFVLSLLLSLFRRRQMVGLPLARFLPRLIIPVFHL